VIAGAAARLLRERSVAAIEDARGAAEAAAALNDSIDEPPPDIWVPTQLDASCAAAWAYEISPAPLATALAGRRGGKTHSNLRLATRFLAQRGKSVIYVSLQEKNASEQFFGPLLDLLREKGWRAWEDRAKHDGAWDYRANSTKLVLHTRWGSTLRAFSAHDMRTVAAVRGYPADLLILDECQEPRDDVVRYLMDKVAPAFVIDRAGLVRMTGTVPQVEPCYFSEALDSEGWEHHSWTSYDHDFPDPRELKRARLDEHAKGKGWTVEWVELGNDNGRPVWTCGPGTSLQVQGEFFAKRIKDPDKQLYDYDAKRNGEAAPLKLDGTVDCDMFAVGLDLGWNDLTTINVRGWRSDDVLMRSWQIYEWGSNHLPNVAPEGRPSIAVELGRVLKQWPAWVIVADDATGGDKIALAAIGEMLGVDLEPKPRNLGVSVENYNEDFRCGRAHVDRRSSTARELEGMQKLPDPNAKGWKWRIVASRRRVVNPDGSLGPISHKDHASASRLAHWGVRAYWNQARPQEHVPTKEVWQMTHAELEAEKKRVALDYLKRPHGRR